MWVTQTYLGTVEPDAKIFVYYFFEDYNSEQSTFTANVQTELENLGEVFGDKVSLLMPNPRYANRVESEVRQNRNLWGKLHGQLPGLFISTSPLVQYDEHSGSNLFLSFKNEANRVHAKDYSDIAEVIATVRRVAGDHLNWVYEIGNKKNEISLWERIKDAIELKPGIAGIRIDLKKL